jgi:hypothetical protein
MAFKDDNKHKYSADGAEEKAEEVPLKKQKTIGSDDNRLFVVVHTSLH